MLIKMITDLRGRMDEDSENFNKELEIILKKKQAELENTITEIEKKNHYKQCRLNDAN